MVNFFIHRPIFASSIAIIMLLAGAIALRFLPVAQLPDVTPPQVVVSTTYPGASAEVVANTVTTPLEQQINGVPGMIYMSSVSANDGSSTITVTFKVGYPVDIAAVDVQNRVASAQGDLPAIVNQAGVTVSKKNPSILLGVSLYSPDGSLDLVDISNYAYLQVVDPLKRLPGVGDVSIFGERRYSMRIWLDPDKLAELGITATDVQNAIAEQNVQAAAGKLGQSPAPRGTDFEYQVNALGRLSDPAQFGDIVIRAGTASEAVVHLRDVARIELGALQYTSSARMNARPTVFVAVYQTPGSNALQVDQEIRAEMARLGQRFPPGLAWQIPYDTTMFVSASMHDVMVTLAEALALVIGVVFLFLQSWRTTIIPAIAIPVSLVFTLAAMLALGFSLNMVTMLGMVLAIGLVVDDAIVVVENVERQLERGLSPVDAAVAAMKEVVGPIIATSAVLMAVFVPVAFLPGVTGRLYNQFALTIAISVAISAFNSLTLSPALCAVLLRHQTPSRFFLFRLFNAGFNRMREAYARAVRHVIAVRWAALVLFAAAVAVTYGLYSHIPAGFLPVEDQGYFFAVMQLPDGAALQRTERVAETVRKILAAEDGVQSVVTVSGLNFLTGANQSNAAAAFAILKPWDQRGAGLSASHIIAAVRPKLLAIPEAISLSFDPPSIPGISTTGGFEFEVEDLTGRGPQALHEAAQALLDAARKQPELDPHQLFTTFNTSTPEYNYDLDRTKVKLLGLNLSDVFNTLQIDLGSLYVNDFNLFGRTFRVTMQAERNARANPTNLSRLYVRNAGGQMIPLDTLGGLRSTVGPEFVSHYNIYGAALINGAPAPGYSSGQAIAAMQRAAAQALPADFGYEWTGIAYQELEAGATAAIVFALALVFVFLFLAAQYESWSMPFMVILSVPLALFGAVLALWLRGMQLDVYSEIGLVMLIGLAAKNAILIVEFAKQRREHGAAIIDAAMEAGRLRRTPALPVPVVPVVQRTVPVYLDFVGTTEAIRSVSLQARVTGYLVEQGAPDGADVKTGGLLYRIDPRPYQAALDQAIANRAHDQANLQNAELNFRRDAALLPSQLAVSRQQYDTDNATAAQLKAQVEADDAAIETARLNLGYTELHASFAGRIGRSQVHEGTLISAAGTQLDTLVQLDPIYVTFNPSEGDLALLGNDRGARPIPAEATIPDEGGKRYPGTLTFLENTVDRNTGTIVARATIANPDHSLLPGEFVHVRLHVADQPDTLLLPQVALGSNQFGKYVYVADHDKAVQRPISIGATYGSYVVITKGLTAHDEVIVGNLQKIAPGTPVRPTAERLPALGALSNGTGSG